MVGPAARLIGGTFLERGLISPDQLESALEAQHLTGQLLGEILVAQGWITRLELADALAEHWRSRDTAAATTVPVADDDNVFDFERWKNDVDRAQPMAPLTTSEAEPETRAPARFLALAPTPGRYRLIEHDGPNPETGACIELSGLEGSFRVVRQGQSPLPCDSRPCVYLEQVHRTPD